MAYGFVNAGMKNPIDDSAVGSGTTWSSEKLNEALGGLQSQVTAAGAVAQAAQAGLATAVAFREEISIAGQADFDAYTGSGMYRVQITAPFGLNGTSEIQQGSGLLTVFQINDVSALQLWLLVSENTRQTQLYWRYLNTENFPVATTDFFRFSGGTY